MKESDREGRGSQKGTNIITANSTRRIPMLATVRTFIIAAILVLFGITIVFGSWYTVDETERGVLLRNGAFIEVVQPGLHSKWPWIEAVYKLDMQTHTYSWAKINSYSADQQPADLKV